MNEEKQNYFQVIDGTTLYYENYVKYLQKQLEAYENMRKEAIEYLDNLANSEVVKLNREEEAFKGLTKEEVARNEVVLSMLKTTTLLNILDKVGDSNE